jgi:hypothetical protein
MKRAVMLILAMSVSLVFLGSCASIFKGPNDRLKLSSKPSGAEIYINGKFAGKTPLRINLKASKSYIVEFKKNDYTSCTYHVSSELGVGWVILDIFGGLVPIAIDAITGSWYYLEPDYLNCKMEKDGI